MPSAPLRKPLIRQRLPRAVSRRPGRNCSSVGHPERCHRTSATETHWNPTNLPANWYRSQQAVNPEGLGFSSSWAAACGRIEGRVFNLRDETGFSPWSHAFRPWLEIRGI